MRQLSGCRLTPLDQAACDRWLANVLSPGPLGDEDADLDWLLAHCDDGVVWGKREAHWQLSNEPFPGISPTLSEINLQQLRLFGARREVLIWRTEDGLRGRELLDTEKLTDTDPLRTKDESYVLLGDRLYQQTPSRGGFSVLADRRGSRHALPWILTAADFGDGEPPWWPLRMDVRHYFEPDPDSGWVRLAASRLVKIRYQPREEK